MGNELFSPSGWEIMRAAKAICLAAKAPEIGTQHIFQGCALQAPDLVRATLAALGLAAAEVATYLHGVAPVEPLPDASTTRKPLSVGAEAVIRRAQHLARQHPEGAGGLVGAVHLWVSVGAAAPELDAWLRACGWSAASLRALPTVSPQQLPPPQLAPRAVLQADELQILNRFCHRNLTALAGEQRVTPAYGMEAVRAQITRCLLKRDKRSVVLTGAAGVGKTKLVEDLAAHIAGGELPALAGCQVFELDLAQFTRGTHLVGSRAERWAQLTGVLRQHPEDVILFIDELHTIVGLPIEGQAMDLANVLKPLLVDDKVRLIGATTSEEYRRYIDGDPALARRFTEIKVPEPDKDTMLRLLHHLAPTYASYHGVRYSEEALETLYELAQTYFPNQAFPAKGVDLLDEVGVHVRLRPQAPDAVPAESPTVWPDDVRETLRRVWGIEPASVSVDIAALLKERVIGQDHAADQLADAVITSALRYGHQRNAGPRAVILFLGPPGVGKSYMAAVLSDILFPGRPTMLTLDMTEFGGERSGEHARFRLLGPPPPYVGWENGGLLTGHALQHPVSVVLVDEFDKAGPEARNILLRVLNDGWVQDGRGRIVSFRGVYFILTANAARRLWEQVHSSFGFIADQSPSVRGAEHSDRDIRETLRKEGFAPELLSRLSHIVVFNELGAADLTRIAELKLAELRDSALVEDLVLVEYDPAELAGWLVQHARSAGDVRGLRAAFERYIETPIAHWRWQVKGHEEPVILRLAPEADQVRLIVESEESAGERIEQLLFSRVASVFTDRAERARRLRTAGARLGT